MKRPLILTLVALSLWTCNSDIEQKELKSPEDVYGQLFKEIQLQGIFEDSKTFVDCVPLYKPDEILEKYEEQRMNDDFSIKNFVAANFKLPESHTSGFQSDPNANVVQHINKLWTVLTRQPGDDGGTLIPLRRPYIVPGGRFGEIYYWDSYFTILGLQAAGEDKMVENMVLNFAQLIQDFGHIPNGNRTYYLSRSQPPFFTSMVSVLAEIKKDKQVLVQFLPQIQREYQYWMASETDNHIKLQKDAKLKGEKAYRKAVFVDKENVLNRYFDDNDTPRPESYREDIHTAKESGRPTAEVYRHLRAGAESGWDYSSRWLKDGMNLHTIHTSDIVPVDLNALLYYMESTLAEGYELSKKPQYAESFRALAAKRKAVFDTYFWDERAGFYYDYDFIAGKHTPVLSLAGVFPLFFKMATPEQAKRVAKILEEKFLKPGGLATTIVETGEQWDAPNGWAPLQWMAIVGLRNYGYTDLANRIKTNWANNNIRVYENTGKMVEKYNVYDLSLLAGGGEYPVQDGFGWSNGVLLKLLMEDQEMAKKAK